MGIEDSNSIVYVSIVSLWEIAIKASLGKLTLKIEFSELQVLVRQNGFPELAISFDHLQRLRTLSLHHRDPFDRLIIAQGIEEQMTIVTSDPLFKQYQVSVLW